MSGATLTARQRLAANKKVCDLSLGARSGRGRPTGGRAGAGRFRRRAGRG